MQFRLLESLTLSWRVVRWGEQGWGVTPIPAPQRRAAEGFVLIIPPQGCARLWVLPQEKWPVQPEGHVNPGVWRGRMGSGWHTLQPCEPLAAGRVWKGQDGGAGTGPGHRAGWLP